MPGFLMHLVEGEMILNNLKKQINISKTFTEEFMLGCILPDVTSDKERTHFRSLYQKYQITKYPDMTAVYALYGNQELSPIYNWMPVMWRISGSIFLSLKMNLVLPLSIPGIPYL